MKIQELNEANIVVQRRVVLIIYFKFLIFKPLANFDFYEELRLGFEMEHLADYNS
jgi:hypothetical protein